MGSCYQEHIFEDCSESVLHIRIHELITKYQQQEGFDGYSGTWAEKSDYEILKLVADSELDARAFCQRYADKWGDILVIKVANPEPHWYAGAWCSS